MTRPFTENFKRGFWIAIYEYFLVTLPVFIYVTLEAVHKDKWIVLFTSPEWSIATIFLSFISISRYRNALEKSGRKIHEPKFGLVSMISLILIVSAAINAYLSLEHETTTAIVTRMLIFLIASSKFIVLLTGSKLLLSKPPEQNAYTQH